MGWLLLLLVSFAAGIVWIDRGGPELAFGWAALPGALLGGGAAAGLVVGRGPRRLLRALGLAALILLAFAAGQRALDRELARARRGAVLAAASAVASRAERGPPHLVDALVVERRATAFGEEVELRDLRGRPDAGPLPERVMLSWRRDEGSSADVDAAPSRADALLWPGAHVRLALRVEPLRPTRNPGAADRERALARRGVGARARLVKPDWVVETVADAQPGARVAAGLVAARRAVVERVRHRLPDGEPGAGLARALVLGDRRDLPESTRRSFRDLGLAHLLSVSGLHIGFVALPAAAACAWLRVRMRPSGRPVRGFAAPIVAGCAVALGYAWLTGSSVPALRSGFAFALFGLARGLGVAVAPGPVLAAVALALVVADPSVLFDPGARFSFTACAALLVAGLWGVSRERGGEARAGANAAVAATAGWSGARTRVREALVDPVRASLAVSLGLLPWMELEGLPRSLPSPLINALAIPWTGLLVMPAAFAACGLALGLPADRGGAVLQALLWPAAALETAAGEAGELVASLGLAQDRPGLWPWAPGLVAIALGFVALRRGRVAWAGLVWIALGGLGLAPLREAAFARERPRVVFFDVGQADAALVETRDAAWLIDSGPGPPDGSGGGTLLRALRALSVDRLDGLVISHADLDHRGGAERLLAALPIGELWLPALARADPALVRLAAQARARGVRVAWVSAGDRLAAGRSLALEVLWPPRPDAADRAAVRGRGAMGPEVERGGRNEQSIVLRANVGGRAVLFLADVGTRTERSLLDAGQLGPVELLKLGHHGSRTSSAPALLAAVAPALAIVSAPCDASRGLPSPEALDRLRVAGIPFGWTGRDGAIVVGWTDDGDRRTASWGRARDCGGLGSARIGAGRGDRPPRSARLPDG